MKIILFLNFIAVAKAITIRLTHLCIASHKLDIVNSADSDQTPQNADSFESESNFNGSNIFWNIEYCSKHG